MPSNVGSALQKIQEAGPAEGCSAAPLSIKVHDLMHYGMVFLTLNIVIKFVHTI